MFDTHAHLDVSEFDNSRAALAAQMQTAGITGVLLPGISPQHWHQQILIANQYHWPYALGIHPWYVQGELELQCQQLHGLIEQGLAANCKAQGAKLVAIGEIGLDKLKGSLDSQIPWLDKQLLMAQEFKLPVIVHCVRAHHQLLPMLKNAKLRRGGVIHGFSGSIELAREYIALGYKLGIGGLLLRPNALKLQTLVSQLPLTSMLVETDSPAMGLVPGALNTPLLLPEVITKIAQLHTSTTVSIREQLFLNATQLFDI
ncbi:TatD family hydrolase [Shewanella sp. SNU WT4]|uniref:TatD family hydrolase n=1 Tax=Shewanella sp. SNU WT4 TaxID=2590015 RepID=UPI001F114B79|nr:TatD family hydrolase [Shewanella sp. SNU WT4]